MYVRFGQTAPKPPTPIGAGPSDTSLIVGSIASGVGSLLGAGLQIYAMQQQQKMQEKAQQAAALQAQQAAALQAQQAQALQLQMLMANQNQHSGGSYLLAAVAGLGFIGLVMFVMLRNKKS